VSRHNEHSLKDAIEMLLKTYRLDDKLAESRLINSWEEVMGKMIAKHTTDVSIRNKQLFVTLDSAALRNELSLGKSKIVKMLNDAVGRTVINEIILR
jgi:predicted nucleic acid-binding Zn ribbon protein